MNELFHDLEGEAYDTGHPEIFLKEKARWQQKLAQFLPQGDGPLTIVDIGAGTGFVCTLLLPHMNKADTLIFADISTKMLDICSKKIAISRIEATFRPLKMFDERLNMPDSSVDIVTINCVLHHIPNVAMMVNEINRVLKPSGVLFIGHEPNATFLQSWFLLNQYLLLSQCTPKRIAASLLKKLGLYGNIVGQSKKDERLEKLNDSLMQERLIEAPLSRHEVSMLVDIHSPTAGGMHVERGLFPHEILPASQFRIRSLETYNHLSKAGRNTRWFSAYERLLQKIFPHQGAIFFLVAEKI